MSAKSMKRNREADIKEYLYGGHTEEELVRDLSDIRALHRTYNTVLSAVAIIVAYVAVFANSIIETAAKDLFIRMLLLFLTLAIMGMVIWVIRRTGNSAHKETIIEQAIEKKRHQQSMSNGYSASRTYRWFSALRRH